ncbi:hypothetical protein OQA88_11261 [Cercophora sp. LCS_1]
MATPNLDRLFSDLPAESAAGKRNELVAALLQPHGKWGGKFSSACGIEINVEALTKRFCEMLYDAKQAPESVSSAYFNLSILCCFYRGLDAPFPFAAELGETSNVFSGPESSRYRFHYVFAKTAERWKMEAAAKQMEGLGLGAPKSATGTGSQMTGSLANACQSQLSGPSAKTGHSGGPGSNNSTAQ